MARLDRIFQMNYPPEQAQELFLRDVGPAFAKAAQFLLQHEKPGELLFSEGDVLASRGASDESPVFSQRDIEHVATDAAPPGGDAIPLRDQVTTSGLSGAFSPHIKVEFTPDGEGTRVEIKGHAEHEVRDAIDRLGTPGHWPETAGDPHD